jgi:ABC-2 type transport system permease protein
LVAFIVPLLLVGITVPDSFAGERERHTLPTLLASRLPDRAILFGKIATAVALGWGVTLFVLLLSLLVVNVVHWDGHLLLYKPSILLANLSISLLVSLLTAGVGILFSLRSATVQQAQQSTMGALLILPMILQFASLFLLGSPSGREWLRANLGALKFEQFMLIVVAVLSAIVVVVLRAAMARFERSRLILG